MPIRSTYKNKLNLYTGINNKISTLSFLKSTKGNLSILMAFSTLIAAILFVSIFDIFALYIAREHTKNASDAIALALAQNLLFFNEDEIFIITEKISKKNDCEIDSVKLGYEEITVTTVKKVKFIFKFFKKFYNSSKNKFRFPRF